MSPFVVKVLEEVKSPINGNVRVVRSLGLGTYIQVEGLTQSGGLIVIVWKKALSRIKNLKLKINNCLILGLGGGTAAKLVKKYWPDAKITGVDIDPIMVELGKKYLGMDKVKVQVHIQDAMDFLSPIKYDLILVDTYLGYEYPKKFESDAFLRLVLELLTDGGVAVFNRLYYGEKRPQAVKFGKKLETFFPSVEYVYPEANLVFICRT